MKKTTILLTGILTSALLFAGCGGSAASSASASGTDAASSVSAAASSVSAAESTTASSSAETVSAGSDTGAETVSTSSQTAEEAAASSSQEAAPAPIEDGTYTAVFKSDSSMFHVNKEYGDRGILTVKDGKMTIHVTLESENIVNLYYGLKEDAQKEGAELIQPTEDSVNYSDGTTDTAYGFDVPVPALDTEFDVALIGTHGNWYDHKVTVSDPVAVEAGTDMNAVIASEA
ncbi:MAG: hypothetical protein U0L49_04940 [Eubacterium sp.]|nr:hypothetical protein [Eubacterium sp.]